MQKKFLIIIVSILTLLHCFREKSFEHRLEKITSRLSSDLDLNSEQKFTLENIKKEIIEKRKSLQTQKTVETARKEFIDILRSEKIELEKLKTTLAPLQTQNKEMRDFILEKFVEFHSILTLEQKRKLAEKIESFSKRLETHLEE